MKPMTKERRAEIEAELARYITSKSNHPFASLQLKTMLG